MKTTKHKTIILLVFFAIYLFVLFKITVFRNPNMISSLLNGELQGVRSYNYIPFTTIAEYFQAVLKGEILSGIANILGNLIIFLPLGFITALLLPKMRKSTRILILAIAVSLVIEGCQYIFAIGTTDIDDVILNALGGMLGYWVYFMISRYAEPRRYAILISALMIAFTCTGFFVGNNNKGLLQGQVTEISNDSIVVSPIYRSDDSATASAQHFEVAFSENCVINLVETQDGNIAEEKTITSNDIRLDDLIVLHQFLISEDGVYMAMDVEVHRTYPGSSSANSTHSLPLTCEWTGNMAGIPAAR